MAIEIKYPQPQPKQELFFSARERYVCYGGARGGGKSWCVRHKAVLMAARYAGIRMLILRRTLVELRENHIRPMRAMLKGVADYRATDKTFEFPNGSLIVFGYCDGESDVDQYQGQEYDVIFMDEATHFTEYQYATLTACLRGANDFPKRMYLTCNPGGPGHAWVKRLFIDRDFREGERPEDYVFIPAKVTDNRVLMEKDPEYVRRLDNLPRGLREAWRDGKWDVFVGQFFTEWDRDRHVVEAFQPPSWWRWYVTMDYGLDMLAALLIGVDEKGDAYVVGEVYEGRDLGDGHDGLIVSEAAKAVIELAGERVITAYLAPPDLWNARQETGRSVADIFAEHGVYLTRTSNDRVDGWMAVKEWLKPRICEDGAERPRLRFFPNCRNIIRTLPLLQYDERRPNDVSNSPHELTHAPDALRGFCVYRTIKGNEPAAQTRVKLIDRLEPKSKRRRTRT
ncbi:MAG: phage terminase large subunit [Oscillospiraceae bacterium]|nr:phage terminase large subunit [Oscillospiraceae bacterium]